MGRKTGFVLVGVGVFLLVLGVLSGTYAYDRLSVAPLNQSTTLVSEGSDATVFSVADQAEKTTDLVATREVVGDVAAGKAATKKYGREVAVWETRVLTAPPGATIDEDNPPLSGIHDRVAFDAKTGVAIDCCGQYTSDSADLETGTEVRDTETAIKGLYYKFPFHAQKRTYQFWDGALKDSTPIEYKDTEKIKGLTVYRFEQVIPPTTVSTIDAPASVFGVDEAGDITLDRVYANTRTLWIEPETGVIIRGQEQQNVVARYQGDDVATLTNVTIGYNDKTVTSNVDDYSGKATLLKVARMWLPYGGGILGALLLLGGLGLLMRSRAGSARTAGRAVPTPA